METGNSFPYMFTELWSLDCQDGIKHFASNIRMMFYETYTAAASFFQLLHRREAPIGGTPSVEEIARMVLRLLNIAIKKGNLTFKIVGIG
jgi:hypothetical protein